MEVSILGPVEADGLPVTGRDAAVLASLALRAPRAASAEALVSDVWGDDPPVTAAKALQNAISRLRRLLSADAIETVAGGYRLLAAVDLHDVERLAAAGDHEAALARWRGDPSSAPAGEQARLGELKASLEDDAARSLLDRGDADAAVATLERLVADQPYRERRWALLIEALAVAERQADALRAAQRARRVLAEDLGLEPGAELVAAERMVLDRDETTPVAPRSRAPRYATSFVGREDVLRDLGDAVAGNRLVSLVGAGGAGKTRVALAAVGDRSVFVDLAAVAGAEHVWEAVAAAAGIPTRPGASVADAVVGSLSVPILLLDSCEHVLDAAAEVADAVECPVLATSREPLGLPDERVVTVGPLGRADAVRLYLDRSATDAASSAEDAVAELCARLDDLPLAIELAAARAPVLGPEQLLSRLEDRFALLDGRARRGHPRHRALGAMVAWSVDLLEDDERRLFQRLSVFRSSFTIEDAEAVVTDDDLPISAVAPAMTRLVRASIVSVDGSRRLRLLDTFRAYGEASLEDPSRWRRRHLAWVSTFATEAAGQLAGRHQVEWFDRCSVMLDDVQSALAWCADHGPPSTGLQIASDLFHFWMGRARRFEGIRWAQTFLRAADDMPALDRCRAAYGAGMIAMMQDLASVQTLAAVAGEIADDRDSRAVADALAAITPLWRGELDVVDALAARCMPVIDEPQHAGTLPRLWDLRAWVAAGRGNLDLARALHRHGIDALAGLEDRHLYGAWLSLDGDLAFAQGAHAETAELAAEALAIAEAVACPSCRSSALGTTALVHSQPLDVVVHAFSLVVGIQELIGQVLTIHVLAAALADHHVVLAAQVAGASLALREQHSIAYEMPGRIAYAAPRLEAARDRLGASRWNELIRTGRELSPEEVVGLIT